MRLRAPTEQDRQSSFLEALYIPSRLRSAVSLFLLPRTKVGNRCIPVTCDQDQAESEGENQRWRAWLFIRDERIYKQALGFRNNLILVIVFGLVVCTGIGIQREAQPGAEFSAPTTFSPTSKPLAARTPVITGPRVVTKLASQVGPLGEE